MNVPEPKTRLGRHRQLSPLAGIHVSPIQLGGMSIGDKWESMGAMDRESSFKLLDAFYEAGGNFIDTANSYQAETSEMFIGEWMEKRGNRDQMVIATKYTTNYKEDAPWTEIPQKSSFVGNNMKSLHNSVNASLEKLRTDYIDILYIHWWDYTCGVEEVMNGLHHLVAQGKVLYLGVSDTPAWIVSKANLYARLMGKAPFVIYQGAWNIMQRDLEREIIPMCVAEGMAIAPWYVLAAGKIRTDEEEKKRLESGEGGRTKYIGDWRRTEEQRKVCLELERITKEIGAQRITSVAIAYLMHKAPYVFPIIGGRKIEHLYQNLEALEISLTDEQVKSLDDIVPFDKGFPVNTFGDGSDYCSFFKTAGHFDKWPRQPATIRPR